LVTDQDDCIFKLLLFPDIHHAVRVSGQNQLGAITSHYRRQIYCLSFIGQQYCLLAY